MAIPASSGTPDFPTTTGSPKTMVVTFIFLTFLISSVFWYFT